MCMCFMVLIYTVFIWLLEILLTVFFKIIFTDTT